MIVDWAGGGTPEGVDKGLPERPMVNWQFGVPDLNIALDHGESLGQDQMELTIDFVLDQPELQDRWIAGFDILPGNRGVLHDVILFLADDSVQVGTQPTGATGLPSERLVGSWIPGQVRRIGGEEAAHRIPAGTKLGLRIHYRKTWRDEGNVVQDTSQLGLYFLKRLRSRA